MVFYISISTMCNGKILLQCEQKHRVFVAGYSTKEAVSFPDLFFFDTVFPSTVSILIDSVRKRQKCHRLATALKKIQCILIY